ncbi:MAG: DNA-directed RNA polymerase subunit alpha C-terminal domain-containing protein [Candidatus Ornithospirochaeta sp.]
MNEEIKQAQIQTQVPSLDFYLTDIEKENLSLFKIQYLPIPAITRNALEKANITTLADLLSTPDQTIKSIRNIGPKGFEEISRIKREEIDELYQARGLQRPYPKDEETLSLLSKLKEDLSYFSHKTEESIWYDICRESLATPISNPFLSYEVLFATLLEIPENLHLLILWFKKLTNDTNNISIEEFNRKTSQIPLISLMINALKHSFYLVEKDEHYMKKKK